MAELQVVSAGLQTSVQGAPRTGLRHLGIGSGGAADPLALALANALVGNRPDTAALEITLTGPTLAFDTPVEIALCGAPATMQLDDGTPLPCHRPLRLPAGAVLRIGSCRDGARSYLAIGGGLALAPVLGSPATDLRGGFGGHLGRALQAGDRLPLAATVHRANSLQIARWWVDGHPARPASTPVIDLLPGEDDVAALLAHAWHIDSRSNRQGLRLAGPPLALDAPAERVSEPVAPGTVQLPPGGAPIILLCDAQTHGGYPRIGHVTSAALPLLGQLRPGAALRFAACTPEHALQARRQQRQQLYRQLRAIAERRAAR